MEFSAIHRHARIASTKVRYVVDLIRGKNVNEALNILKFVHRRATPMIRKVLNSAIANASQHAGLDMNDLKIAQATADGGPMIKRFRPGPMGRAMRIRKRTCHIRIAVAEAKAASEKEKTVPTQEEPPKQVELKRESKAPPVPQPQENTGEKKAQDSPVQESTAKNKPRK